MTRDMILAPSGLLLAFRDPIHLHFSSGVCLTCVYINVGMSL